jgi:predicted dehydrogenase
VTLRVVVLGLGARGGQWARLLKAMPGFELAGGSEPDAGRQTAATLAVQPDETARLRGARDR